MSDKNKIGSFAVLDLETNTLPDYNFNKVGITEISIHGFAAEDICTKPKDTCDSPRVNHKLTLLFNPRMLIHPKAEEITRLNNYMLEKESYFDENAGNVIIGFLKHLRQPVCLVAHNGIQFDFRILKQAFDKIGLELPSDVICIDSYEAIRELDRLAEENEVIPFSQDEDANISLSVDENLSSQEPENPIDLQKLNETTPKRTLNVSTVMRNRKNPPADVEEVTPPAKIKSRRSLFNEPNPVKSTPNVSKPGHYKLENIYERLFGEPPKVAHHADADVVSLERVMIHYGDSFVEYAQANAKPFRDVKRVGAC